VYRGLYTKQKFYLPPELGKKPPRVAILSQFDKIHDNVNDEKQSTGRKSFESLESALCRKNVKGRRRTDFSFN
jgi:hypothetical protein